MTESKGLNVFDRPRAKLRLPIPKPVLERIGTVVAWTSVLESNIQTIAGKLIGDDQEVGMVVTSDLPFPRLVSLVRTLYVTRLGTSDPYKRLDVLLKQAAKLYTQRGVIVHSMYGPDWDDDAVRRFRRTQGKAGLKVDHEKLGIKDLDELADKVQSCALDFIEILIVLYNRRPAQVPKSEVR